MNTESEHPYTEIVWEFAQREGKLPSKPPIVLARFRKRIDSIIMLAEKKGSMMLTTRDVFHELAIPTSTATHYLRLIANAGVLERIPGGNRTWSYIVRRNLIPNDQVE